MKKSTHLVLICTAAFMLRAAVFIFFTQQGNKFYQPDSLDYHGCALFITHDGTMTRPDTKEPIFWRTPGYPAFLSFFYDLYGVTLQNQSSAMHAQKAAIWVQIALCSLVPILIFLLALLLTGQETIAYVAAWIAVFHVGFILTCGYIATDALASLFFYIFLLLYYRAFLTHTLLPLVIGIISLGLYTWIRPMGELVGYAAGLFLLFQSVPLAHKIKRSLLFLALFVCLLSPWYIRNYTLTGKFFFWPATGAHLLTFNAPKIVQRVTQKPLLACFQQLATQVEVHTQETSKYYAATHSPYVYIRQFACLDIAWPWIRAHPFYAAYDWIVQVIKTTCDLYAAQFVAFAKNTHGCDPLEEFLTEKIAGVLWQESIAWPMRLIAWLETLYHLCILLSLLAGLWIFLVRPLLSGTPLSKMGYVWLITLPLIGLVLGVTGSFGYARLRIPIEPLLIILALSIVYAFFTKKSH